MPPHSFHLFLYYLLALVSDAVSLSTPSAAQTCSHLYQSITTSGDQTGIQVACRNDQNPQRFFICDQKSCEGTRKCQTCVSQSTNVSVNSMECAKYYAVDSQKTTSCWTSADEEFTCYGECTGAAVCSGCTLDEQTPSISNCAGGSSSKHSKASHVSSASTTGVTTWLSWD